MARKKLTPEQIAARTAKAKATREAKKKAALELMGATPSKFKKPRKKRQLTDEQKAAAAERLKKAREAKAPAKYSMVADNVRILPDDHPISLTNVRSWIKTNKQLLSSIRSMKDSKDSKERNYYTEVEVYINNLENYIRSGVYLDNRYGDQRQSASRLVSVAMAYYPDGTPKRTPGVWYPDIGTYTHEMANEDNERRKAVSHKSKVRKAS